VLAPFSYSELILLAFASWLVFNEPPDLWFYLGAPFIIGSGIYIWFRELELRRQITVEPVED
jgi:drug/metabolite transporter (DMT)-like permease